MAYSEKLIDHYEKPRNVGALDKAIGRLGAPLARLRREIVFRAAGRPGSALLGRLSSARGTSGRLNSFEAWTFPITTPSRRTAWQMRRSRPRSLINPRSTKPATAESAAGSWWQSPADGSPA